MSPHNREEETDHEMFFVEYVQNKGQNLLYLQRWRCNSCGRTLVINKRTEVRTVEVVGNSSIRHFGGIGARSKLNELTQNPSDATGGIYFLNKEDQRYVSKEEADIRNQWEIWIEKMFEPKKK